MPPVFHMDPYATCLFQTNGTYCFTQFVLTSDTQSDLLDMINVYESIVNYVFLNGTLVVQSFFVIAGLLLAYKMEDLNAQGKVSWKLIPMGVLQIFLRLIPSYGLVILFSVTWFRRMGSGPLWHSNAILEADSCSKYWWTHLLFINNYFDSSYCMVQMWFLAAYVQLMVLGLFVCVLARNRTAKIWTLCIVFIIGMILPAAHTFYQNLEAVLLMTPEFIFSFNDYETFNHVYKRGHTNVPAFILGIALGYYIYHGQKKKVNTQKYEKYQLLFKLTVPVGLMMMFVGLLFKESEDISPYTKAVYAGLMKPIFGFLLCLLIFSSVFKIEHLYRRILEWNLWRIPSRLSYIAYVIHITFIRLVAGLGTSLNTVNYWLMIVNAFGVIASVYILTIPFWLLIEGPINEVINFALIKEGRVKTSKPEVETNQETA
ncbi:unnamed protein product [Leptosia nina]|uniref:Acyltransferase 3 domain-containing protein n=1 Tax=Leptosia nina TaxID=320188 RepID=A0AAV1JVL1_9NEOP